MEFDFYIESIIKIILGAVCGAILGFERKKHNKVIGMRTLVLICVSSTLLSLLSYYMASFNILDFAQKGDPTRIAAGVISGIGFLGGGAIMKQGLNIEGLTSAAIIWAASSFGLAIGAGLYIQVGIALITILFGLNILEKVEAKWFPAEKTKSLHVCFEDEYIDMEKFRATIKSYGLIIIDTNISRIISTKQLILHCLIKSPKSYDFFMLIDSLKEIGTLSEFSITN